MKSVNGYNVWRELPGLYTVLWQLPVCGELHVKLHVRLQSTVYSSTVLVQVATVLYG